jgi:iron complex outermembrane receptor protein
MFGSRVSVVALLAILCTAIDGFAQAPQGDLSKLSVDDLMNVEVTSVARRGQKLSDTPAAVFVITQDDIQRSGATTIPDVLRMVPGLDVAAINNNLWAVSSRGFNGRWSNKLLVMIDGRTIYSPVFSGVFWDQQDVMLEDIDRIEVIRGPGGTLWGANAVNGVINIITKNAVETQGGRVSLSQGGREHGLVTARYGGALGDNLHFRTYVKSFDRPQTGTFDAWTGRRGGFRADWVASPRDNVTVQGEIFRGTRQEPIGYVAQSDPFHGLWNTDYRSGAASASLQWTRTQSSRSETKLQIYYTSDMQHALVSTNDEHSIDVDFQHQLSLGTRNEVVWGAGYRRNRAFVGSEIGIVEFDPDGFKSNIVSAFVQDELRLPHGVRVTFGAKAQRASGQPVEVQPTLRVLWRPSERHVLWGAYTKAVRTPSWAETAGRSYVGAFPDPENGKPAFAVYQGNPELEAERAKTTEVGYRWMPTDALSVDVAAFDEDLDRLVGSQPLPPYRDGNGTLLFPITVGNADFGHTRGVELLATSQVNDRLELSGGYSLIRLKVSNNSGGAPASQIQLRSALRITPRLELDAATFFVDRIASQNVGRYIRFDGRLAWKSGGAWDLSIAGQNLFDRSHREFIGMDAAAAPVGRSIYGSVTWNFR